MRTPLRLVFPVLALVSSTLLPAPRPSAAAIGLDTHVQGLDTHVHWPIPADWPVEVFEAELPSAKTEHLEGQLGPRRSPFTAADVHAALRTASPRTACIVRYEIGGFAYDPYKVGSQGERGPAQLHPRGLLPLYLRWSGGAAPENPYQAVPFIDWGLRNGYATHWSPVLRGRC